ncbi:MAG TPA: hypothetical protein VGQ46_14805 [Thermoanaerobaculia bacterium]|nr:hypothetical protein [Thermoanaerobaculia bacterium]
MRHRAWIALALLVAALFVYLVNYRYRYWAAGGDTTPAELLPLALARNHDLVFDGFEGPGSWWFHHVKGHVISGYPIIPGFFNVPAYAIARERGIPLDAAHRSMLSMISASVVTAVSVLFFFLAASRVTKRQSTAIFVSIVYAFGTTAASVAARGMWQHGPSLLFLTCALWLLTRGGTWPVALSAIPLGFAVFNRPVNIVIVLPLAAYVFWQHRRAFARFALLALVPASLLAWYSAHYWGSVTALGQYPAGNWFLGSFPAGLAGLLISPSRGLFIFTPLFLISAAMIVVVFRHPRREPLLTALAVGVILTIVLYAKWYSWWGGTSFGYRLLTECIPALSLLLGASCERMPERPAVRMGIAVLTAISLYVHMLGAFYYPSGFETQPNDINSHPERLWSVRDGEIARCSAKFAARIQSHLHR